MATDHTSRRGVKDLAVAAVSRLFGCPVEEKEISRYRPGAPYSFQIYAKGVVIGCANSTPSNEASCDRACAELLWLTLWPGAEQRVYVVADEYKARLLVKLFTDKPFPRPITVYRYDRERDELIVVANLGSVIW